MKLKLKYNEKIRMGPYGIHIYNRKTGLNILVDEIDIPPSDWTSVPRHVSIALTNKCNLNCPYCFSPKEPAELDFDRLICWLDQLDDNGCFGVGFGGGEPTLYEKLPDLCRYTSKFTGLAVTLTTHGHNFNNTLIEQLSGNVHFIRISMDGVGSTYESLRGRSFKRLMENIKVIRSIAPFGINFLVNSITFPDLNDALSIAINEGASEFLLLPQQQSLGSEGIDKDTNQKLVEWVKENEGIMPLTISAEGANGFQTCNPTAKEDDLSAFVHIDAKAFLKASSFDSKGVKIDNEGIICALELLSRAQRGSVNENMERVWV